jgi:BASS family bile acid:Na+ symporter
MNSFLEFAEAAFGPLVLVFTLSNLASMGLQVDIPQVLKTIRNPRFLGLVLVWGWVVGPALGYLITRILPLAGPFAAVVLLTSLAPCAPFLPPVVERARGDLAFAGAFIPAAAVGTVVFMPLIAPQLIQGLTLSVLSLATPLVLTVLIPLLIGAAIRTYAAPVAAKLFRPVKAIAGLSTALTVLFCVLLYAPQMLDTAGSFALASMTLFMLVMGLLAYRFGFGLKQSQRSVMSMGMGTRNIAAVFAGVLAIPNGDPRMVAMVVMWTLWSFVLAKIAAPILGRLADTPAAPQVGESRHGA